MASTELRAAAQQALEAYDKHEPLAFVMEALRVALAEPDLFHCPKCGGPADNGHDRSIPPSPYWCTKCMAEPVQEPVACLIGTKGSAFDSPTTKRAYTYAEQPGNVVASRLGLACNAAASQSAGDSIDRGLGLLQELQRQGFGVFDLGAEYAAPPQRPAEPVQEPVAWVHPTQGHMQRRTETMSPEVVASYGRGGWTPLYTSPPQRKPLTEEEIDSIWDSEKAFADIYAIARAVERAHGIGA